jgi:hypothetical protein
VKNNIEYVQERILKERTRRMEQFTEVITGVWAQRLGPREFWFYTPHIEQGLTAACMIVRLEKLKTLMLYIKMEGGISEEEHVRLAIQKMRHDCEVELISGKFSSLSTDEIENVKKRIESFVCGEMVRLCENLLIAMESEEVG